MTLTRILNLTGKMPIPLKISTKDRGPKLIYFETSNILAPLRMEYDDDLPTCKSTNKISANTKKSHQKPVLK